MNLPDDASPIDPQVRIGHVHLKVANLERSLRFYCGVLGFQLTQRYGAQAAYVSAGGYHHHIGLNTWESQCGSPPPPGTTGLCHVAILYPTRSSRVRLTANWSVLDRNRFSTAMDQPAWDWLWILRARFGTRWAAC